MMINAHKSVGDFTREFHKQKIKPLNKKATQAKTRKEKDEIEDERKRLHIEWWETVRHHFVKPQAQQNAREMWVWNEDRKCHVVELVEFDPNLKRINNELTTNERLKLGKMIEEWEEKHKTNTPK